MMSNLTKLEHRIGDKVYHLLCDQDSPIHEVKEALFQFLKFAGQVEDAARMAQQAASSEDNAKEEDKQ